MSDLSHPFDLGLFFHPRSIAVVGASDREGSPNRTYWNLIRAWGGRQQADVFPVNPNRDMIDDVPCFADLSSLPTTPNVVAVLTGDPIPSLREAVELGVDFVVVFASGYAEAGPDGARRQQELKEVLAGSRTRLIGPNTNLNTFEKFRDDLVGSKVALITQSGHQGRPIYLLQELGIPVAYWAPTGNEADLGSADFLSWFVDRPDMGAVALYLEAISDVSSFVRAATQARTRGVPLLVVKSGSSEAGKKTALTHTGKLAGSSQVVDAFFDKFNIVRLDTLEEWTDTTRFMVRAGRPDADGLAVVSISGGTSAYSADLVEMFDLRLAEFDPSTITTLRTHVPEPLKVDNPVDTGGHPLGDHRGVEILRAVLDDPNVGVLVCPLAAPFPPLSTKFLGDLAALSRDSSTPICVIWSSPLVEPSEVRTILDGAPNLHFFRSFRNCLTAIASWQRYHAHQGLPIPEPTVLAPLAGIVRPDTPTLDELAARQMLVEFGLAAPAESRVSSVEAAVDAASQIGFPVVVKGLSAIVQHKMAEGLVALDVTSPDAARVAAERILHRLDVLSDGTESELLVSEQVADGLDLLVGSVEDPEIGVAIVVGLGGTHAELISDVAHLIPPFSDTDVVAALGRLRNQRVVDDFLSRIDGGHRQVATAVLRFTDFVVQNRDRFTSVEVNPLRVTADGRVVMLDTLVT